LLKLAIPSNTTITSVEEIDAAITILYQRQSPPKTPQNYITRTRLGTRPFQISRTNYEEEEKSRKTCRALTEQLFAGNTLSATAQSFTAQWDSPTPTAQLPEDQFQSNPEAEELDRRREVASCLQQHPVNSTSFSTHSLMELSPS
jgi:hypothetical protein